MLVAGDPYAYGGGALLPRGAAQHLVPLRPHLPRGRLGLEVAQYIPLSTPSRQLEMVPTNKSINTESLTSREFVTFILEDFLQFSTFERFAVHSLYCYEIFVFLCKFSD